MPRFQISARLRDGAASCPLCSETLARGGPARECPGCEVRYHVACLEELGGCGTLGCDRAKRVAAAPRRARRGTRDSSSQPPLAIGALIAIALGFFVAVALKEEKRGRPRPAPARQAQRPLDPSEVQTFVTDAAFLVRIRALEARFPSLAGKESLRGSLDANRDGAMQAYEFLLESEGRRKRGRSPSQIQEELTREVMAVVAEEDRGVAPRVLRQLFAEVDRNPVFEVEDR